VQTEREEENDTYRGAASKERIMENWGGLKDPGWGRRVEQSKKTIKGG